MDKALLVGINAYPGAPLAGCLNDVEDMARFITGKCGFNPAAVRLLTDNRATTSAIKDRLLWLVSGLLVGDRILFHYSGHGAQVPTRDKKGEIDGLDEVVCPSDFDWSDARLIRDKEFGEIFRKIPVGIVAWWISDSCLVGGTKIPLLEGNEKTIAEMAAEGGTYWVYSTQENGEIVPGRAHSARVTGIKPIMRVGLDNGRTIECTADERFMLRDGTYREAGDLRVNDSLMPLYRKVGDKFDKYLCGYEMVMTTKKTRIGKRYETKRDWKPTHLMVRDGMNMHQQGDAESICHHRNFNKRDNRPANLQMVTWKDHQQMHGEVGAANFRKAFSPGGKLRVLRATEAYRKRQAKMVREAWQDSEYRRAHLKGVEKRMAGTGLPESFTAYNFSNANRENTTRRMQPGGDLYEIHHSPEFMAKRRTTMRLVRQYGVLVKQGKIDKTKLAFAQWAENQQRKTPNNHKVIFVEHTGRTEQVYDLTVDEFHNFSLSAGVFVHNCHSGDLGRNPSGLGGRRSKFIVPPLDIRWRFEGVKAKGIEKTPFSVPNVAFISGCRSDQTSADASFRRRPNGALTRFLIDRLSQPDGMKKPMPEVIADVRMALKKNRFDQVPQLEGPSSLTGKSFLGR